MANRRPAGAPKGSWDFDIIVRVQMPKFWVPTDVGTTRRDLVDQVRCAVKDYDVVTDGRFATLKNSKVTVK